MIERFQGGTKVTLFRCTICGEQFRRNHPSPFGVGFNPAAIAQAVRQAEKSIEEIAATHICKEAK